MIKIENGADYGRKRSMRMLYITSDERCKRPTRLHRCAAYGRKGVIVAEQFLVTQEWLEKWISPQV